MTTTCNKTGNVATLRSKQIINALWLDIGENEIRHGRAVKVTLHLLFHSFNRDGIVMVAATGINTYGRIEVRMKVGADEIEVRAEQMSACVSSTRGSLNESSYSWTDEKCHSSETSN